MDSVLVLLAAPGSGAITDEIAARLGNVRWLAKNEALECSVAHHAISRELCTRLPIDINAVPQADRRKRILIADMDSTMIQQECIDELGVVAGVGHLIKAVTLRAMRGEIDFEAALKERVALLKGLPQSAIIEVIDRRITA